MTQRHPSLALSRGLCGGHCTSDLDTTERSLLTIALWLPEVYGVRCINSEVALPAVSAEGTTRSRGKAEQFLSFSRNVFPPALAQSAIDRSHMPSTARTLTSKQ